MTTKQDRKNLKVPRKSTLAVPWLLISCAYLALSVFAITFLVYMADKESALHKNLRDRAKTVVELSAPGLKKAISGGDDVAVLNYLQDIAKLPDVIYARIIDGEGNIIADAKVERWGKKVTDVDGPSASRLVKVKNKPIFFKRQNPLSEGYDYVFPLLVISSSKQHEKSVANVSTGTVSLEPDLANIRILNVGVSSEKLSAEMSATRANALYVVSGVIFAGAIVFYLMFHFVVLARTKKIQKSLESVLLGGISERIPVGKSVDEITSISDMVNKVLDKVSATLESNRESEITAERLVNNFVREMGRAVDKGIIALDGSDNIIYINDAATKILGLSTLTSSQLKGKHIIDAAKTYPSILDALKKSAIELGTTIREHLGSVSVSITAIDNGKGQVGGTVIVLE